MTREELCELVAADYNAGLSPNGKQDRKRVKAKQVVTIIRSLQHGLPRDVVAPAQKMSVETLGELVTLYEIKQKDNK